MTDHARAKGLPAPPSLPGTPPRPGDVIDEFVQSINKNFDLDIQLRGHYSPSKLNRHDIRNKVYEHIKFLSFKNREALYQAIQDFDSLVQYQPHEKRLSLLHKLLSIAKTRKPPSGK